MAKAYRSKLLGSAKKTSEKNVPVSVEIIGAIEKIQQVAGMPKVKPFRLTSYKEAADIINQIEQLGVKDVSYKLSGFINGGVNMQQYHLRVYFYSLFIKPFRYSLLLNRLVILLFCRLL